MRMLMRVSIPNMAGGKGIDADMIGPRIRELAEKLHPEAAYFFPEHGHRTGIWVFDLKDPSDLPSLTEALFAELNASVEVFPTMNIEDLKRGLAKRDEQRAAHVR